MSVCTLQAIRADGSHALALAVLPTRQAEAHATKAAQWLTPAELQVVARYTHPRRRNSYLLGRMAAKEALLHLYPGARATEIEIAQGVFRTPLVRGWPDVPGACVSISHDDRFACAIAAPDAHPVTLDIQEASGEHLAAMLSPLQEGERRIIDALHVPQAEAAALLWTAREALSKMLLTGFSASLSILEVASAEAVGGGWQSSFRHFSHVKAWSWRAGSGILTLVIPAKSTLQCDPAGLARLFAGADPPRAIG